MGLPSKLAPVNQCQVSSDSKPRLKSMSTRYFRLTQGAKRNLLLLRPLSRSEAGLNHFDRLRHFARSQTRFEWGHEAPKSLSSVNLLQAARNASVEKSLTNSKFTALVTLRTCTPFYFFDDFLKNRRCLIIFTGTANAFC